MALGSLWGSFLAPQTFHPLRVGLWGVFEATGACPVLVGSAQAARYTVDWRWLRAVPTCGSASRARVLGALGALPAGYVVIRTRWEAVAVTPLSKAPEARVAGAL